MSDSDRNVDEDFEFSRQTYYDLIQKGKDAIDKMLDIAVDTEHPRSFEVLGNMIKQISDVNDKLMDVNKKRQDMKKVAKGPALPELPPGTSITNHNLFVGSTTDLQRFLLDQAKQKDTIADNVIDITNYRKDEQSE